MPEDFAAVADVAADTGGIEAPDVSVDTTDSGVEPSSTEVDTESTGVEDIPAGKLVVDGKLSPAAKAALDAFKAADPKNAKIVDAIRRDAFQAERFRRELPGGVKELQEMRSTLDELTNLGGEEGLDSVYREIKGFRELDQGLMNGDPRTLDTWIEDDRMKEGFLKLVPTAMEKYRELHPDGYASYVSKVFQADMQACGIPRILDQMSYVLGDNQQAQQLLAQIKSYVDERIPGFASKQVEMPKLAAKAAEDPERSKFEQERQEFTRQTWDAAASQQHQRIFDQAWAKHVGSRTLTPDQKNAVMKLYNLEFKEGMGRKKDFIGTQQKFLQNGQKDGFLRMHQAATTEVAPLALRKALAALGIGRTVTPGVNPKVQPKNGAVQPKGKPAENFIPANAKPSFGEIDQMRTTASMLQQRRAVLRNGKSVSWK